MGHTMKLFLFAIAITAISLLFAAIATKSGYYSTSMELVGYWAVVVLSITFLAVQTRSAWKEIP